MLRRISFHVTQSGYTLIEVITITAVGALLIISVTGLVGRSIHISRDQFEQVRTTEDARRELERTSNTIRSSQDVRVGAEVKNWLQSGDNFSIEIYSNIDGDAEPELVKYFVEASSPTTIQRRVIQPDSTGTYTGEGESNVLTRSLQNQAPDEALFYYLDKAGNVIGTPLSADDIPKVVSVGLAWRIDHDPNAAPGAQDLSTEVTPRHNTIAVTATPVPQLLPPTNFDCEPLSSTQIHCTWVDPNPAAVGAPSEDGFRYYDVPTSTVIDGGIAANTTTYIQSGLTPDTTYTRDVTAFDATGETAHSNPDTVTTLASVVSPPTLTECHANSGTSITCTGEGPPVPPGEPTPTPVVSVEDPITDPPTVKETDVPDINGNFSTTEIGLSPGRSYDRIARVTKGTEQSGPSNMVTVDTPCTIGAVTGSTPSPSPSSSPSGSPFPTPRYSSSTAPCFTIGLSVTHVLRVDPASEAILDVSAGYEWLAKAAGSSNDPINMYNGGTPSAFSQLEVVQGTPYVVWLRHAPGTPLAGQDECRYLTESGYAAPDGNSPDPITVGGGQGASNYKLVFYYMPLSHPSFNNPDRNFTCKIFEQNGPEIRPNQPMPRVLRRYNRTVPSGVITDNIASWTYTPVGGFSSRGYFGTDDFPIVTPGLYSISGLGPLMIPFSNPWPHFFNDMMFWQDTYSEFYNTGFRQMQLYLVGNYRLLERWTGTVLYQGEPIPPIYTVTLAEVTVDGVARPAGSGSGYYMPVYGNVYGGGLLGANGYVAVGETFKGFSSSSPFGLAYHYGQFNAQVGCSKTVPSTQNVSFSLDITTRQYMPPGWIWPEDHPATQFFFGGMRTFVSCNIST